MKDQDKTKGQLIDELAVLRQRVAELEKSEIERKQTEEALYEIEEMFRLFMDYSPIYVFFKDENIRSIQLSKNYEKMLGRPVQELIGKTMDDLFPSELAKSMVEDDLRILRERKPIEVVEELNGRFYTTTKFPITREGKPPLLAGFTIDITERKRVEEALRKSEEYFRRLTKQSPVPIAIIGDSGEVDFVNERFSATFGYTFNDLPNLDAWRQRAYPDEQYRQEAIATWQEATERAGSEPGDIEPHEYRVTCKDGTIRIVEIFGSRIENKILVLLNDITERKQNEKALRESEANYRELTESISDIFFEMDYDLRYTYWNKASENLTGVLARDAVGKTLYQVFPNDPQIQRAEEMYRQVLETQESQTFVNSYHLGNKDYSFEISAYPSKRGLSVFVRDITKRVETEEALQRREKEIRIIADNVPALFSYIDAGGYYRFVNKRYEEWFGVPRTEIIGRHYRDFLGEAAFNLIKDRVSEVLSGRPVHYEEALPYAQGSARWIMADYIPDLDDRQYVVGFYVLVNDISDRKRAEESLRESEERCRLLLENAPDLIYRLAEDGRITALNLAFEKITGWSCSEWLGKHFSGIVHPDDLILAKQGLEEVLKGNNPASYEMRFLSKSGGYVIGELTSAPEFKDGRIIGEFGIVRDITERKLAEDQLKSSREQLRKLASHLESVREEERSRIAREIHDELGQTLTGLKFELTWLKNKISRIDSEKSELVEKINSMSQMITSTIQWARKLSTNLRPGLLDDYGLVAALEWQVKEFETRTGIHCLFDSFAESVALDSEKSTALFRICQESLTNVARHANATAITIGLREDEGNIILEISDNGRGITESEIGDPKSFGILGMRERVRLLRGDFSIGGSPGKGTTIIVRIPLETLKENK